MLRSTQRVTLVQRMMASTTAPLIKKINRVLIANRGEIAIRVMKTARKMGIESVAVFSDVDRNALFVKKADQAYHIGPAAAAQSYLNIDKIIDTALKAGAQGVHPGYGFLSENAKFAERCAEAGLVFIGPPVQAIRDMGTKSLAKQIMQDAKVPVVEGFHGADQSDGNLKAHAEKIGYPVMLKAVYGGGGKGMRIAWSEEEFDEKLASARSEAMKSFGNDEMLVEKFVERPRHVEVQVFGDHHDNYVYLWERDCSVQRRHQKIIEEAPSPAHKWAMKPDFGLENPLFEQQQLSAMWERTSWEYILLDPSKANFYFTRQMNTRLQVWNIPGTDLVEWQLKVGARGKASIETGPDSAKRVYAEDTKGGSFMPTAGKLDYVSFPSDARIDTGVVSGDEVSVHYDPMIAKVVVWGEDRATAAARLDSALSQTRICGLPTNIKFVQTVLRHPEFIKGNVYTDFIPDHQKELFSEVKQSDADLVEGAVGLALLSRPLNPRGPFEHIAFFRVNHPAQQMYKLGEKEVTVTFLSEAELEISFGGQNKRVSLNDVVTDEDGSRYTVEMDGRRWKAEAIRLPNSALVCGSGQAEYDMSLASFDEESSTVGAGDIQSSHAPMPGIIEKVLVKEGDEVQHGQPLVVMTAMKMEYTIRAPAHCKVAAVSCAPGKNVPKGKVLVKFASLEQTEAQAVAQHA
ncbi:putative methylcrotonoyl-CoA carboxylase, alpha subunit [Cooperia oncophora]